jgi:dienelactone hydrolase
LFVNWQGETKVIQQIQRLLIIGVMIMTTTLMAEETPPMRGSAAETICSPWNLAKLYKAPTFRETTKAQKPGVKGLLYSSLPYAGKPVEVFAYYSAPKGEKPASGWPAVVCVHGGGGTAFDAWVKKWNDHGYAAISMDLEGHYPINKEKAPGEKRAGRVSTEKPGPSRVGVFGDFAKPVDQQWYYHAVAQVILAHSLIRSLPEVDANRTGVTGISWGGNLTSTVMGVDDRFKFAVPVYGCGFLPDSDGHQGRSIKPGKHRENMETNYDGSAYFKNVTYPTLWVNGTNDRHFAMPATQKSSRAVQGPSTLRFQHGMKHGHGPGWAPKEIYAFADSVVKGGKPLPKVGKPTLDAGKVTCALAGNDESKKVELFYTKDSSIWPDREWKSIPATDGGKTISAEIPNDATAVFFAITDNRGLMVTSEYFEVNR